MTTKPTVSSHKAPRKERLSTGCKGSSLASHGRLGRVSVGFTIHLSGSWQARKAVATEYSKWRLALAATGRCSRHITEFTVGFTHRWRTSLVGEGGVGPFPSLNFNVIPGVALWQGVEVPVSVLLQS